MDTNPHYDPACGIVMERRSPFDRVYPQVFNTYILITSGTDLILRCEGLPESAESLTAGVYKLDLEHPCSLHGVDWKLSPTFQRQLNISLHAQEIGFNVNVTFTELFSNLSVLDPLILDLELMDEVDRKQINVRDLLEPADPRLSQWTRKRAWHGFWGLLLLAIAVFGGVPIAWRRRTRNAAPPSELQPAATITPSPQLFKFQAADQTTTG